MTGRAQTLAIIERAYRGAVEKQFFDPLYMAIELHRQLGGIDLLLRGQAVAYAAEHSRVGPLRVGDVVIDTLTDSRKQLQTLIGTGVAVWVEEDDLATTGLAGAGRLLPDVRLARAGEMAEHWATYQMVCFI